MWFQTEIVGQLNGQMGEMIGGMGEMVGEELQPKSEDIPEQHEEEEEEMTMVRYLHNTEKSYFVSSAIGKSQK